jgi:hypothetical protein
MRENEILATGERGMPGKKGPDELFTSLPPTLSIKRVCPVAERAGPDGTQADGFSSRAVMPGDGLTRDAGP